KLVIKPEWAKLEKDVALPPEDVVLNYIKDEIMVKRKIFARAQTTIQAFTKKFNEAFLAKKVEERANFPQHFLEELKKADPAGYDTQFKAMQYMRTALADYSTYNAAHQEKITPATTTPHYLSTFFDHINKGELKDFQTKLSDPLNYSITWENNQSQIDMKPGGAITFLINAVENLDPAASQMAFDEPATQAVLIERVARKKAPELAKKAAEAMKAAWEKDPTQISKDPTVVVEYVADASPASQRPRPSSEEMRQEEILDAITTAPIDPNSKISTGQMATPGTIAGPAQVSFDPPPAGTLKQAGDEEMLKCYVIGFVVQYHQLDDPAKRLEADSAWRSRDYFQAQWGSAMFPWRVFAQSVRDAYIVTLVKKKNG
ncbi:MAG TPA: hypothetical protein VL860_11495, partial [Planctomycetota bacterium]|nr:hypothetical protein [Planctomycetota bacterium]